MQVNDDVDLGSISTLNLPLEFQPILCDCLLGVSAQMSNKHLKFCMPKTELVISPFPNLLYSQISSCQLVVTPSFQVVSTKL